jgi:hypothetical protein
VAGTAPVAVAYPVRASAAEIPGSVVKGLLAERDDIERLRAASTYEPGVGANPALVFDPLLRGLLRGASSAWRADSGAAAANAAAVSSRISELVGSVRVLEPPGPYSLGTRDAPILLTVANGLPVTMTVQVDLASVGGGLRVSSVPVQRVPPLGRVQVRVDAEVTRSGTFPVEAAVRTPDGGALGPPTRLQVRSTVYGVVTVWLTVVAGVALVILAGYRIVRRIRSGDGGAPGAGAAVPPSDRGPDDRPTTGIAGVTAAGGSTGSVGPPLARVRPPRPAPVQNAPPPNGLPERTPQGPRPGGDPTGPTVPLRQPPSRP